MAGGFPLIPTLLPHSGPMLLLDRILAHDDHATRCAVAPDRSFLFQLRSEEVPAWVALEYMAQCAAVHGSLLARLQRQAPPAGLFVGSRRVVFRRDAFRFDEPLAVTAKAIGRTAAGAAFQCRVTPLATEEVLVTGQILVAWVSDPPRRRDTAEA